MLLLCGGCGGADGGGDGGGSGGRGGGRGGRRGGGRGGGGGNRTRGFGFAKQESSTSELYPQFVNVLIINDAECRL